jgi:uncharacterized protein YndB with AHSA1/START domain
MNAVADRIELEVLLLAPPDVVWRAVSQPEQLAGWFCDAAVIDARPGGRGAFTFDQRAARAPVVMPIVVERLDPPRAWAYRWMQPPGAEAAPSNSLLVDFQLEPDGRATRLRVVESGLLAMDWTEADRTAYFDQQARGWAMHLESLRQLLTRST